MKNHQIILVAGGTCSGKSEFAKWFKNALLLELDRFYLPLAKIPSDATGVPNFDTPKSIDIAACASVVEKLSQGAEVEIPIYSYVQNDRVGTETIKLGENTKFIIVEGLYALYSPLRELGDIKIFLDTPSEIRVARRMIRDVERKQRPKTDILANFILAEDGYEKYVEPTKDVADLVVPFSMNPMRVDR